MQKRIKLQHNALMSVYLNQLNISGICFDTLLFKNKLIIRDISLDSASVWLFKDKIKPVDKNHLPEYLGQSIGRIPIPLFIGKVNATNADLINREFKADSTFAEAHVNRVTARLTNFTNLLSSKPFVINGDAYLENKAHFKVMLSFDYVQPRFGYKGSFSKFKLSDLNRLIEDYAPASIHEGMLDEIEFTGEATKTSSNGIMKFLYHDLEIGVKLEKEAKWNYKLIR